MLALDDTIAAIATAPGAAGLAVVRVSGPQAIAIADELFRGAKPLARAGGHTLHHGWIARSGAGAERIDEVVAAVFRAPRSYTREDVVEFSCHGGALASRRLLEVLIAAGARLAGPGEFTLRAFLHGRIDLAQAEAVADLIEAESDAAREQALSQLAGELSRRLLAIEDQVAEAAAEIEARVDFAEDVGGIEVPGHVLDSIARADAALLALLEGSPLARARREGLRVPIVGRPNVGKSSLFNALLGEERAIVTATPGTTRDRVSETLEIAGVRVTLSDTAGVRESADAVELIGVERTLAAIEECRVAIWVVDASCDLEAEDRAIAQRLSGRRVLLALNKRDRERRLDAAQCESCLNGSPRRVVAVSASRGEGLDDLRAALADLLGASSAGARVGPVAAHPRHIEALERSRAALARASEAARRGEPGEIVALELRESLEAVGEVTGRHVTDDLMDRVFSRFCIGK